MQIDEINENEEVSPTPEEEPNTPAPITPDIPVEQTQWGRNQLDLSPIRSAHERIKNELQKIIVGQAEFIDLLLAAVMAGGHVMVEGVPGIAKTLTAKLMAQTLEVDFSRIQFTPDLMPSDVIGTTVFNMQTSAFSFNQGPIFANFILIDEINRAPAKTQAALFEVMEEHQVTVDGQTYPMTFPFFVIATQNPIEQEGTYKLPEAQLDRFIVKINLEYPSLEEEAAILHRFRNDFKISQGSVDKVFSADELKECQDLVEQVHIKQELLQYIARITHNTRNNGDLFLGASPRASLAMLKMAKATAALAARDFVTPDDIQQVAYPVLNHRIILTPEREMEGFTTKEVIKDIIEKIEVPR
ncbi:MAG: MoxR family ATPase [Saprospiraceae bacterium]|nr:MoxR family ATPase [Saprospiraceae bacterium]